MRARAERIERLAGLDQVDARILDPAAQPGPRQAAVERVLRDRERAQFAQEGARKSQFAHALGDFCRRRRDLGPIQRLHEDAENGLRLALIDQRLEHRIAGPAAIPVDLAVDRDRREHLRQAGRCEQGIDAQAARGRT